MENEDMVLIPGGQFRCGTSRAMINRLGEVQGLDPSWFEDEIQREKWIAPFWLDRGPVTNAAFKRFVAETHYQTDAEKSSEGGFVYTDRYWSSSPNACWWNPSGRAELDESRMDHPVVHISCQDATAYAQWANKRLPEEYEWEYAAGGKSSLTWPWGNTWLPNRANTAERYVTLGGGRSTLEAWRHWWQAYYQRHGPVPQTTPVGNFTTSEHEFGLHDMVGNVKEWTLSVCCLDGDRARFDPIIQEAERQGFRSARGGSWMQYRIQCRCQEREYALPFEWSNFTTGFRCARDA